MMPINALKSELLRNFLPLKTMIFKIDICSYKRKEECTKVRRSSVKIFWGMEPNLVCELYFTICGHQ